LAFFEAKKPCWRASTGGLLLLQVNPPRLKQRKDYQKY